MKFAKEQNLVFGNKMKFTILFIILFILFILIGFFYNWVAAGAIGTFSLAIATFRSLWQYKKREEKIEHREISEKIVYPLLEDIEKILRNIKDFEGNGIFWRKEKIEYPQKWLFNRIDNSIKKDIENLHRMMEEFNKLFAQCVEPFKNIIIKEFELRPEIKKLFTEEDFWHIKNYPFRLSYRVELDYYYSMLSSISSINKLMSELLNITLWKLLFEGKTLEKYINEYLTEIKKELNFSEIRIKNEAFFLTYNKPIRNLRREKVSEIFTSISKEIFKNSDCQTFVKKAKNIFDDTKDLKENLENFIKKN